MIRKRVSVRQVATWLASRWYLERHPGETLNAAVYACDHWADFKLAAIDVLACQELLAERDGASNN